MTPKEKAQELYNKFNPHCLTKDFFGSSIERESTKQCVIIAVKEIITLMIKFHNRHIEDNSNEIIFWQEVITEIEEL